MRVVIFLGWYPVITETFIRSELDILKNSGIDFMIYYIDIFRSGQNRMLLLEYDANIFAIPPLPKPIINKVVYILYYQVKLFLYHPIKYTNILFWILMHYHRGILRSFTRLARYIPDIAKFHPDIFYCHYTYSEAIFAGLAKLYFLKNYGIITHEMNIYEPMRSYLASSISPSFILVKAEYVKKSYIKRYRGLTSQKIEVIPWGIDCKYFRIQGNHIHNRQSFTMISIAQIVEKKGLMYLLQACKILMQNNTHFRCLVIGNGPEKSMLQKYIDDNNLSKFVTLYPAISRMSKKKKFLSSADLFVLPSVVNKYGESDIIPNVLLEAMAMELPVITTKVGGMVGVIKHGESGFFVQEKDPADLADTIQNVINMPIEKRRQIGSIARKIVVERFDKEKQGNKFIIFLKSQLQNNEK